MKVFYRFCRETKPTVIALGYFDGVHIGHEKVIMQAMSYKNQGLKPILLTFKDSPRFTLQGINEQRLTTLERKIKIFSDMGIESLYIVNFTDIQDLSAEFFVKKILSDTLNVRQAVCGFNYTFGMGGGSCAKDLKILGDCSNIKVDIIPPVKYKSEIVSSTRIRKAVISKNMCDAKNMTKNL